MDFLIRNASEKDDKERAFVLFSSWNETYRGLISDEYLNSRDLLNCEKIISNHHDDSLVALVDGKVVGFISFLKESREFVSIKPSSEIVALYILKKYHNNGIGKMLIKKALEFLPKQDVVLFVLKGNDHAIKFYTHFGFVFTGKELKYDVKATILIEQEMVLQIS